MHGTPDTANDTSRDNPPAADLLRRLLLVDDEPDGAAFAAALLRSHGLDVTVIHSADEALQALSSDKEIDAVLSDITMPGMTGLELADEIRLRYPAIKIVLMSGYMVADMLKNREPPYQFATKPYRIDSILELLHR